MRKFKISRMMLTRPTEVPWLERRTLFCRSADVPGCPRRIEPSALHLQRVETQWFVKIEEARFDGRPGTAALREKSARVSGQGTSVR